MSNIKMFRKLLNSAKDKVTSPPNSPTKATNDADAQGFLCPICMKSLSSADGLQTHFTAEHGDKKDGLMTEEIYEEGFLCPICKKSLASAEELTAHYEAAHDTDHQGSDVVGMRREIEDLKTSLKEEKSRTDDLTKEIVNSTATQNGSEGTETEENKAENELLQQQLSVSEESRTLLSSEVQHLQGQLASAADHCKLITDDKDNMEQKLAQLAGELSMAKAVADEGDGQRAALEDHIKTLKVQLDDRNRYASSIETQLSQRPGSDDVLVLKQEMITIQTLMDKMSQDSEREMEKLEGEYKILGAKHQESLATVKKLQSQLNALPKVEELQILQAWVTDSNSTVQSLESSLGKKREEITRLQEERDETVQQKEEEVEDLRKQLGTTTTELQNLRSNLSKNEESSSELQQSISSTNEELESMGQQLSDKQAQISTLEGDAQTLKDELETIHSQIQGVTDEKKELDLALDTKESELKQSKQENMDVERKLNDLQQEMDKMTKVLSDKESSIDNLEKQFGSSKTETQEFLHQKEQQLNDLKLTLEKTQSSLESKEAQIDDVNTQLTNMTNHYQTELSAGEELKVLLHEKEAQIGEEARKSNLREEKIKELEQNVTASKDTVQRLESERTDLFNKIEAGEGADTAINQLKQENTSLQERLTSTEELSRSQTAEFIDKEEVLHKQLQEVKVTLQTDQDRIQKLQGSLEEKAEKLNTSLQKCQQLETDLNTKSDLLLAAEAGKSSQRADLENHIKTAQNVMEEKTNELTKTRQQLEQVQDDLSSKKERITQLEGNLKVQTDNGSQLQQTCTRLEKEVREKTDIIANKEDEHTALQKESNTNKKQCKETKAKLIQAEKDHATAVKSLNIQVEKVTKVVETKNKEVQEKIAIVQATEQANKMLAADQKKGEKILKKTNSKVSQLEKDLVAAKESHSSEVSILKEQQSKLSSESQASQKAMLEQINTLSKEKSQLTEVKASSEQSIVQLRSSLGQKHAELESQNKKWLEHKSGMIVSVQQTADKHKQEMSKLFSQIQELHGHLQKEKEVVSTKSASEIQLQAKIEELEVAKYDLNGTIKKLEEGLKEKDGLMLQKEKDVSSKYQELQGDIQQSVADQEILQTTIKNLMDGRLEMETDLHATQTSLLEYEAKYKSTVDEFNSALDREKELTNSFEDLSQIRTAMNTQMVATDTELQQVKGRREELEKEMAFLTTNLTSLKISHEEATSANTAYEKDIKELRATLKNLKSEKEKEISSLQEVQEMMIGQKLEMQNKMYSVGEELKKEKKDHADFRSKSEGHQKSLAGDNVKLQKKYDENIQLKNFIEKERDESVARFEMQLSILNENLCTVRSDLSINQKQVLDLNQTSDELRGEKLELEAKLENNNDERRVLLERCLSSENEGEKLRASTAEMRRKFDDTKAALQELGRENQNLQIITTKVHTRKWTDDSDVGDCMACGKAFSVTVRRHHCRNCGNIFCTECSARQCAIASSKKPVRVCDTCYADLSQKR